MYSLGTWFVSGICVWIPYIKETMMLIIIMTATKNSKFILLTLPVRNITSTQHYKLPYTLGLIHFGTVQVKVS